MLTFFDIYVFISKINVNFVTKFCDLVLTKVYRIGLKILSLTIVALAIGLSTGCHGGKRTVATDSVSVTESENYHADNDIAMTVRSLMDALKVGEKLDSANYDYRGVLTDGVGRPLYTTVQGVPGQWEVDVTSSTSAVIRNTHVGDLLPLDLEHYLVNTLESADSGMVPVHAEEDEEIGGDTVRRVIYDFGGGFLRIETRKVASAEGVEGAVMNITAAKYLPI